MRGWTCPPWLVLLFARIQFTLTGRPPLTWCQKRMCVSVIHLPYCICDRQHVQSFTQCFFFDGNWPLQFSFPINSPTHPVSKAKTTSFPQSVNKYGNHKIKRQKHRLTENRQTGGKTRWSVWGKCLWPPDQTLHQYSKPHQLLLIISFHMHTSSYFIPLTTTVSSSFTCPHLKWFYRATLW